jgi:hypothetical protein
MKKFRHIPLLLLGLFLLGSPALMAAKKEPIRRVVWNDKQSKRTGLYTTSNYFVSNGVSFAANAMYYFGDVDNEGVAFSGGFNSNNLSYGGSFVFGSLMPVSRHCNMRYSLMVGTLSGNNKTKFEKLAEPRDDFRKFRSVILQPAVGVECYPFSNAGFYVYGGIALAVSFITNYEFYYYARHEGTSQKTREVVSGKTFGFLPMVQVGIGYTWQLPESWTIGVELMLQEGLVDTKYMNLDGWPMAGSQNSAGVDLGQSWGTYINRYGHKDIHWNDGWFQLGITVSYRWRNCERCRILNNYNNIRARRR